MAPVYDSEAEKAMHKDRTHLWGIELWKYEDILKCTDNFSKDCLITEFSSGTDLLCGKVFRGSNGDKQFTVKIWDENIDEGRSFVQNELFLLHDKSYKCIAKPIGFVSFFYEDNDLPSAVIYDIKTMDSVRNLIPKDTFSWSNRMKVALGIAVAIRAYHPKFKLRSVDAANFLCDKDYTPQLYEFSMICGPYFGSRWQVDGVMGSRGYADPYAVDTGECSVKSDVFAFGLVLLSLITKKLVNGAKETTDMDFVKVVQEEYKRLKGPKRKRPSLAYQSFESAPYFDYGDASAVTKLALTCIRYKPDERPDMDYVVRELNSLKIISNYCEKIGVKRMLE